MSIQFRPATSADANAVASMVAALLGELVPGYEPDVNALTGVTQELLAMPTVNGVLAFEGGTPVGLVMLNDCAAIYCGGRFGEITELYVDPVRRSKGIAAGLLAKAVAFGQNRGWQRIEVGAPGQPEWARTLQFYLREGFSETGPRLRRLL